MLKELTLTQRPGGVLAGREREEIEAGLGDIREKKEEIPGGWEWIWVEDPWTGKWEQVRVPHEEAERQRRQGLKPRPSYWGETEAKEWRRKLREEREAVAKELERKKAWHLAELQEMRVYPGLGWQTPQMGVADTLMGVERRQGNPALNPRRRGSGRCASACERANSTVDYRK